MLSACIYVKQMFHLNTICMKCFYGDYYLLNRELVIIEVLY